MKVPVIQVYHGKKALSRTTNRAGLWMDDPNRKLIGDAKSQILFRGDDLITIDYVSGDVGELLDYLGRNYSCQTTEAISPDYLFDPDTKLYTHYKIFTSRDPDIISKIIGRKMHGYKMFYYNLFTPVAILLKDQCLEMFIPSRFTGFEQRLIKAAKAYTPHLHRHAESLADEKMLKLAGFLNYGPLFRSLPYYSYYHPSSTYGYYFDGLVLKPEETLYGDAAARFYLTARERGLVDRFNTTISKDWLVNMKKGYDRVLEYTSDGVCITSASFGIKSIFGIDKIW